MPPGRNRQRGAFFNRSLAVLGAGNHRLDCVEHDDEIERQRHVLDVVQLVLQFLQRIFPAGAVPVAHLRPSRDAGLHDVALPVERNIARETLHELRTLGSRPHEAHLTNEDIPQLGKLVETTLLVESQNSTGTLDFTTATVTVK